MFFRFVQVPRQVMGFHGNFLANIFFASWEIVEIFERSGFAFIRDVWKINCELDRSRSNRYEFQWFGLFSTIVSSRAMDCSKKFWSPRCIRWDMKQNSPRVAIWKCKSDRFWLCYKLRKESDSWKSVLSIKKKKLNWIRGQEFRIWIVIVSMGVKTPNGCVKD